MRKEKRPPTPNPCLLCHHQPPLHPPVPEAAFPALTLLLTSAGLAAASALFVYEKTAAAPKRATEAALAGAGSVALGGGLFFLALWSGLYV